MAWGPLAVTRGWLSCTRADGEIPARQNTGHHFACYEHQKNERVGAHQLGLAVGAGSAMLDAGDEVPWQPRQELDGFGKARRDRASKGVRRHPGASANTRVAAFRTMVNYNGDNELGCGGMATVVLGARGKGNYGTGLS